MDDGNLFRTTCRPTRCIQTKSRVRETSDADTWLPVTHLPCHHGLRKKRLTVCLKKCCRAILKCTADLQGNEADNTSVSTAPQAPCRATCLWTISMLMNCLYRYMKWKTQKWQWKQNPHSQNSIKETEH